MDPTPATQHHGRHRLPATVPKNHNNRRRSHVVIRGRERSNNNLSRILSSHRSHERSRSQSNGGRQSQRQILSHHRSRRRSQRHLMQLKQGRRARKEGGGSRSLPGLMNNSSTRIRGRVDSGLVRGTSRVETCPPQTWMSTVSHAPGNARRRSSASATDWQ